MLPSIHASGLNLTHYSLSENNTYSFGASRYARKQTSLQIAQPSSADNVDSSANGAVLPNSSMLSHLSGINLSSLAQTSLTPTNLLLSNTRHDTSTLSLGSAMRRNKEIKMQNDMNEMFDADEEWDEEIGVLLGNQDDEDEAHEASTRSPSPSRSPKRATKVRQTKKRRKRVKPTNSSPDTLPAPQRSTSPQAGMLHPTPSLSQMVHPEKSLMERFHTEFITSLHTLQKPQPLRNTSILFYDEKIHHMQREQRKQQNNARRRQHETRQRLKNVEEKKEKEWRKWLRETMRAASPTRKSQHHRSTSSLYHTSNTNAQHYSRIRTAPARVVQQRLQNHAAQDSMSSSVNMHGDPSTASDKILPQRALTSMSMNTMHTRSKYERRPRPNTQKTYEVQQSKCKKPKSNRTKALDSWYENLMTNIQHKYGEGVQDMSSAQQDDSVDASNWRRHREKEIYAKSFHFDSDLRYGVDTDGGTAHWRNTHELTSW